MVNIITGDSAEFTFTVTYAGMVADMVAPDLTACTVKFMIKKDANDPDSKALFVQSITHPDTNIVHFMMSPAETTKLKPGVCKGACKLFYDSGTQLTVWQDNITITTGVFNG